MKIYILDLLGKKQKKLCTLEIDLQDLKYRKGVVAVVLEDSGKVLVCERSSVSGAWQFPQGGVDEGESFLEALYRELSEEIGCGDIEVLKESASEITYDFPTEMTSNIAKNYRGQSQKWFLCKFIGDAKPDLSKADEEFQDHEWVSVESILKKIVRWKYEAYCKGLKALGLHQ